MISKRGSIKPPPTIGPFDDYASHVLAEAELIRAKAEWAAAVRAESASFKLTPTNVTRLLKAFGLATVGNKELQRWRWLEFAAGRAVCKSEQRMEVPNYLLLPHSTNYAELEGLLRVPVSVLYAQLLPLLDNDAVFNLMLTCRQLQAVCHRELGRRSRIATGGTPVALRLLRHLEHKGQMDHRQLRIGYSEHWRNIGKPTELVRLVIKRHTCVDYLLHVREFDRVQREALEREHAFIWQQFPQRSEYIKQCTGLSGLEFTFDPKQRKSAVKYTGRCFHAMEYFHVYDNLDTCISQWLMMRTSVPLKGWRYAKNDRFREQFNVLMNSQLEPLNFIRNPREMLDLIYYNWTLELEPCVMDKSLLYAELLSPANWIRKYRSSVTYIWTKTGDSYTLTWRENVEPAQGERFYSSRTEIASCLDVLGKYHNLYFEIAWERPSKRPCIRELPSSESAKEFTTSFGSSHSAKPS